MAQFILFQIYWQYLVWECEPLSTTCLQFQNICHREIYCSSWCTSRGFCRWGTCSRSWKAIVDKFYQLTSTIANFLSATSADTSSDLLSCVCQNIINLKKPEASVGKTAVLVRSRGDQTPAAGLGDFWIQWIGKERDLVWHWWARRLAILTLQQKELQYEIIDMARHVCRSTKFMKHIVGHWQEVLIVPSARKILWAL